MAGPGLLGSRERVHVRVRVRVRVRCSEGSSCEAVCWPAVESKGLAACVRGLRESADSASQKRPVRPMI
jgi:hypothetical protein